MKKKIVVFLTLLSCFLLTGCFKDGKKDVLKDLSKKINDMKGYHLEGILEIQNNEDNYSYDVNVTYTKDDKFRVSLKNKINNHEQIILKNKDGVYVLTPSLNKSFKFQSEWPYNNSQSYLLQTLLKDIKNDEEMTLNETENGYTFNTKANYSNNKNLVKENINFDKDLNITSVEVMNDQGIVLMKMNFSKVEMDKSYDDKYFTLKDNMETSSTEEIEQPVSKIEDIIYPMYIPNNTYLSSQDTVSKDDGERVILTFSGEKPFMFVQETVSVEDDFITIPMYGEPSILSDTIGAVSDSSITWFSNGMEYYVVSDVLTEDELMSIAKSVSVMPVSK